jgi:hypothetical protein
MPEVVNPTEDVGALALTVLGTGLQIKRGTGAYESIITANDATGSVTITPGSGAGAQLILNGQLHAIKAGVFTGQLGAGYGRTDAQLEVQNGVAGHALFSIFDTNTGVNVDGTSVEEGAISYQGYNGLGAIVQRGSISMMWYDSVGGAFTTTANRLGVLRLNVDKADGTSTIVMRGYGDGSVVFWGPNDKSPGGGQWITVYRTAGRPSIAGATDLALDANYGGSANTVFINAFNAGNVSLALGGGTTTVAGAALVVGSDLGGTAKLRVGGLITSQGINVKYSAGIAAPVIDTTAGLTSDQAFIAYARGGNAKWWAGLNVAGLNNDYFDIFSATASATYFRVTTNGPVVPNGVFIIGSDPGGADILRVGGNLTLSGILTATSAGTVHRIGGAAASLIAANYTTLSVTGSLGGGMAFGVAGTSATQGIIYADGSALGISSLGTNPIVFVLNGSSVARFNNGGAFVVGTDPGGTALVRVGGGATFTTVVQVNANQTGFRTLATTVDWRAYSDSSNGYAIAGTFSAHPYLVAYNGIERIRVDGSGTLISASVDNGTVFGVTNSSATGPYGISVSLTGASPNNNTRYFLLAQDSTTVRAILYSNGGLANFAANNVNLSDERVKRMLGPIDGNEATQVFANLGARGIWQRYHYIDQTHNDDNLGTGARALYDALPTHLRASIVNTDGWSTSDQELPEVERLWGVHEADLAYLAYAAISNLAHRVALLESVGAASHKEH